MYRMGPAICLSVLLFFFFPSSEAQAAKASERIAVSGTLVRVAGIGGETTGWAIHLDSPIELGRAKTDSVEVSGRESQFAPLENKHVEAKGSLASRHGVTRGTWTVLRIQSIHESKRDG